MSTPNEAAGADLRTIVAYSLVAGLCVLIPVPIVDDWARDLMRQRQTLELARAYGVRLSRPDGKALACGYQPITATGCLQGCLTRALVAPVRFVVLGILRKIVRKILFFLTLKDMADAVSTALHEGYLIRHALAAGALETNVGIEASAFRATSEAAPPAEGGSPSRPTPAILRVRKAIEAACLEVDTRPISKLVSASIRGGKRGIWQAGRSLSRLLRSLRGQNTDDVVYERLEKQGETDLAGVIDEMAADLQDHAPYLRRLEMALEHHLMAPEHQPPAQGSI